MKRTMVLGALVAAGGISLVAQQNQARPPLPDLVKVKDNLYLIASSNPGPEFTGGNVGVHTKANMAKMDAFKGKKERFLPKKTYNDKLTVGSGRDSIDLYYFGPGHTNGDTWVVYRSLRVLQTGDMFAWRDAPTIDRTYGGSGIEYPKTIAKAIAGIKNVDTVIPGHSPVTTPKDLQEFQRFLAEWVAAVQDAAKAGKSIDDAAASIDLTAKYPGYKKERYKVAITAVYNELGK